MKRILFIINPVAGNGHYRKTLKAVQKAFPRHRFEVIPHLTKSADFGKELMSYRERDFDLVLCSGGDGTVSQVAEQLYRKNWKIPLGYFPAGTTNDLGRSLGLSTHPMTNLRVLKRSRIHPMDLGCLNGKMYVYVAAFGAFTATSVHTPQPAKKFLGHHAYVIGGVSECLNLKEHDVDVFVDGQRISGRYILGYVSNSRYVGGFTVNSPERGVDFSDGLFEVVLFERPKTFTDYQRLLEMLVSEHQPESAVMVQGKHIRFHFKEPVEWTVDGEHVPPVQDVDIRVVRNAIRMVYPDCN